jgi:hypothetical protein
MNQSNSNSTSVTHLVSNFEDKIYLYVEIARLVQAIFQTLFQIHGEHMNCDCIVSVKFCNVVGDQ